MKICPHCGKSNDDSDKFCRYCGTRLASAKYNRHKAVKAGMLKCSNCGYLNLPSSQFCCNCGAKLIVTPPKRTPISHNDPKTSYHVFETIGAVVILIIVLVIGFIYLKNRPQPGPERQADPYTKVTPAYHIGWNKHRSDNVKAIGDNLVNFEKSDGSTGKEMGHLIRDVQYNTSGVDLTIKPHPSASDKRLIDEAWRKSYGTYGTPKDSVLITGIHNDGSYGSGETTSPKLQWSSND